MKKKYGKKQKFPKAEKPVKPKPNYKLFNDPVGRFLAYTSFVLSVLAGVLLSFKHFKEPDLWWMFRTGEWILQNGHPPFKDQFSYTMEGVEWINVKWGFEVLATLFQKIGGPEFVYVLQALVTAGILILIFKTYRHLKSFLFNVPFSLPLAGLVITILAGLLAIEFRINGRPEMVSHFFVVLYTLFLMAYKFRPSKQIFWLIFFQIIWTNFHEAYGIGIVMLTVFAAGCWIDYYTRSKLIQDNVQSKPVFLTWTLLLSIIAMSVNFYGPQMIIHPLNIFGQLGDNQYTTELLPYTHPIYWDYQAYLNLAFAVVAFSSLFMKTEAVKPEHKWYLRPLLNVGTGYFLFLCMFFYLSLTAYRNIPFFILVSLPWVAVCVDNVLKKISNASLPELFNSQLMIRSFYVILVAVGIAAYVAIASGKYYETFRQDVSFGLQVDAVQNPVGVSDFIEEHNIEGRCFSDYLTSSYLMWRFRPDFKTFIDLRDLDVFPMEFFDQFAQIAYIPHVFDQADTIYGFDYVVLFRPNFSELHRHLFQRSDYIPVFADPVAVLYVKEDLVDADFIEKYGFNNGENDIFQSTAPVKPSGIASFVNKVFWPFYQIETYEDVNFDAYASIFYQEVNASRLAGERAQKALQSPRDRSSGYFAMGSYMIHEARNMPLEDQRENYRNSYYYFEEAHRFNPKNASPLLYMGKLNRYFGNHNEAIYYLEKAISLEPSLSNAYTHLAAIYNQKAEQDHHNHDKYLRKRADYLRSAHRIQPEDINIQLELGITRCRLNQCRRARNLLKNVEEVEDRLDAQSRQNIQECLERCG